MFSLSLTHKHTYNLAQHLHPQLLPVKTSRTFIRSIGAKETEYLCLWHCLRGTDQSWGCLLIHLSSWKTWLLGMWMLLGHYWPSICMNWYMRILIQALHSQHVKCTKTHGQLALGLNLLSQGLAMSLCFACLVALFWDCKRINHRQRAEIHQAAA